MPAHPLFARKNQPTHDRSLASQGLMPCGCPAGELHDCNDFPLTTAARAYLTAFDAMIKGEGRTDALKVASSDLLGRYSVHSSDYRPAPYEPRSWEPEFWTD